MRPRSAERAPASGVRRVAVFALVLLAMPLGAAELHEWTAGRRAMEESDVALRAGNVRNATLSARRAAEAAVPGSPYPARGYARLEVLARTAEREGRLADAELAWRAMRSAVEATFPAPAAQGRREEAEGGILRLAASPLPSSAGPRAPEGVLRHDLTKGEPPSPWLPAALGWTGLAMLAGAYRRRLGPAARAAEASAPIGESPADGAALL